MFAGLVLMVMPIVAQGAPGPVPSAAVDDQALKNKRAGEAYLAANQAKSDVVTLESGVQYRVLKAGTGAKPTRDDAVVCHFRGTLTDGTEFSSSTKSKRPAIFPIKKVNKGLAEALQLMPAGSKWEIVIPSALAYGERGVRGHVGPNATVIFEVEMIAVRQAASAERPRAEQTGVKSLRVSFKLDPRLTQGLYMGERWVSPPKYNRAADGQTLIVEAQAVGVDAVGRPRKISATWTPADSSLVSVASGQGNTTTITVHRPGESRVRVEGQGLSTVLDVKAAYVGKTLQVEISQGESVAH